MTARIEKPVYTDEFKENVLKYVEEHPEESIASVGKRFGIADTNIHNWRRRVREGNGNLHSRGSGNHSSDEAKEIARLKKELKDTQDALDVLKKAIGILGR